MNWFLDIVAALLDPFYRVGEAVVADPALGVAIVLLYLAVVVAAKAVYWFIIILTILDRGRG